MELIDTFRAIPWFYIGTMGVIGLAMGSFFNVVIHRLPIMMEAEWKAQCMDYFGPALVPKDSAGTGVVTDSAPPKYNLITPSSSCPACGHKIAAVQNIPVLSYLFLRGKCAACNARISFRYPLVELLTGLLTGYLAWHFGVSSAALGAILFTWALLVLTFIDADTTLLPDDITLPLVWLGLLFNLGAVFTDIRSAIFGAIAGYLVLWLVYWGFKLLTGKEGMGYGDFKLLAAIGAWLGWQMLPAVILLSAVAGTLIGLIGIIVQGRDKGAKLPFGPYLAIAAFIALVWGNRLNEWYLGRMP